MVVSRKNIIFSEIWLFGQGLIFIPTNYLINSSSHHHVNHFLEQQTTNNKQRTTVNHQQLKRIQTNDAQAVNL